MIHLNYHLENRLLSKIYDLHIEGRVKAVLPSEIESSDIVFKPGRFFRKKEARFVCRGKTEDWEPIIAQLNDPLITERIQQLDLSEVTLQYLKDEGIWKLSSRSIIGSSVSLMFPPLTRYIAMQPQELILLYELYSMIAAALKHAY